VLPGSAVELAIRDVYELRAEIGTRYPLPRLSIGRRRIEIAVDSRHVVAGETVKPGISPPLRSCVSKDAIKEPLGTDSCMFQLKKGRQCSARSPIRARFQDAIRRVLDHFGFCY